MIDPFHSIQLICRKQWGKDIIGIRFPAGATMNIKLVSFYAIGCCSKIVFNHDYGGKESNQQRKQILMNFGGSTTISQWSKQHRISQNKELFWWSRKQELFSIIWSASGQYSLRCPLRYLSFKWSLICFLKFFKCLIAQLHCMLLTILSSFQHWWTLMSWIRYIFWNFLDSGQKWTNLNYWKINPFEFKFLI